MIFGRVEVPGDPPYTLTLGDDRRWHSEATPETASALNTLHEHTWGEWNGTPGAWQLNDAARLLGGTVIDSPLQEESHAGQKS